MRTIAILTTLALLGACTPPPPCEDQICIQQRQIDAYRSAALLNYSAKMLAPPPQQNIYVYRY